MNMQMDGTADLQRYRADRGQVNYALTFRMPFFDLPEVANDLLQSLFTAMHSHWIAGPQDMKVSSGATLAEAAVEMKFFNGNCTVSVRPLSATVSFSSVSRSDISLVVTILGVVGQVLTEQLPPDLIADEGFSFETTIYPDGGRAACRRILHTLSSQPQIEDALNAPALDVTPGFKSWVENRSEGWRCIATVEPRVTSVDALYVAFAITAPRELEASPDRSVRSDFNTHIVKIADALWLVADKVMAVAKLRSLAEQS